MKRVLFCVLLCSLFPTPFLSAADTVWLGFPIPDWKPEKWSQVVASVRLQDNKPLGSAFLKQLRRQALLIAARDGLGAATRDEFLSETAPDEAVRIAEPDRFLVEQFEGRDFFSQIVDYPTYVAELEKLSRTDFVTALEKVGATKTPSPKDAEPVDWEEIDKLLADFALVPHVEAIRRLHTAIRHQGESLELLTALVKGYTQLQILTNSTTRDTHRVFQARAILYAQRTVALFGENPETLSIRAAAWSLNNFHRMARQEFAAIPVSETESAWIRLARHYAEFDLNGIDTEQPLGKLLKFCLLTYSGNHDPLAIPYGESIVADLPDCSRVYQNLFYRRKITNPKSPAGKPFTEHLARRLPQQLRKLQGEPQAVSEAVRELRELLAPERRGGILQGLFGGVLREQTEFDVESFYVALADLLQAMNEVPPEQDRGEPSLQTLATLLQDETFFTAFILAVRRVYAREQDKIPMILLARSVIDTHPGMDQLVTTSNDTTVKEAFRNRPERNIAPFEMLSQLNDMSGRTPNSSAGYDGLKANMLTHRLADPENVRDQSCYLAEARWRLGQYISLFPADMLEKICPNNPLVVAERNTGEGTCDNGDMDTLRDRFIEFPNCREAMVKSFLQSAQWEKGLELLRYHFKREADRNLDTRREFVFRMTRICLERGNDDAAVEILKEFGASVNSPYYQDYANRNLGQILCTAGKLEEAETFLNAAGKYDRAIATFYRSRRLEMLGKFDDAEAGYRDIRETQYAHWWATCFRTNHVHLDDAADLAYDKILEFRKKDYRGKLAEFPVIYYILHCMDIPMEEDFGSDPSVRVFFDYSNSKAGFQAFFEALEAGDKVKSNALLKFLRYRGDRVGKEDLAHLLKDTGIEPDPKLNPIAPLPALRLLAGMFELDQRSEKPGVLNPEEIETYIRFCWANQFGDGVLDLAAFSEALYLLGRYHLFYGHRETGLDYYRRLFALRNLAETYDECFALRELRKMGIDQKEILAWTKTDPGLPTQPMPQSEREQFAGRISNLADGIQPRNVAPQRTTVTEPPARPLPKALEDVRETSLKALGPTGMRTTFETLSSDRREFTDSVKTLRSAWRLDQHWTTFKASYGIPTIAETGNGYVFSVLGDDNVLFRSEMVFDHLDRPLELEVRNVNRLELVIDSNGNRTNGGTWFSPILIRQ